MIDIKAIFEVGDVTWPVPDEIDDYLLCTELYHCLPDELDRQNSRRVSIHAFIHKEIKAIRAKKEGRSLGGTSKPDELNEFYEPEKVSPDKPKVKLKELK